MTTKHGGTHVRAGDAIIDRRLSGKNKSIGNKERFHRRYKEQIKEAVKRAIDSRGIRDVEGSENITIPKKNISEPVFRHGDGGNRKYVHPGNREFTKGDRIARPQGGSGGGSGKGQASDSGEGEDDFTFTLTKEEFMQVFFEDLALPNLVRTTLTDTPEWKYARAGFTTAGTQNNLSIIHSMRRAIGRRIVFHGPDREHLLELLEELDQLESCYSLHPIGYEEEHRALCREIDQIEAKIGNDPLVEAKHPVDDRIRAQIAKLRSILYLDPIDLRFRDRIKVRVPTAKAVMFCLMDVSGSMDEGRKDLAKRFFILLYLFLTRHYERIDIVFLRHHTQAKEVDEENFFHSTETGGTIVSSVLALMEEIIRARYNPNEWNIYGAQASDGDNWHHDSGRCIELLEHKILPLCRYFAYVQVTKEEQELWGEYKKLASKDGVKNFKIRMVNEPGDIYPVFRDLFKKETTT